MLIAEPIVILDYCWWLIELPHHFEIYSLLLLLLLNFLKLDRGEGAGGGNTNAEKIWQWGVDDTK